MKADCNDERQQWRVATNEVKSLVKRDYGERCPDYHSGCWTCRAWKMVDELALLAEY